MCYINTLKQELSTGNRLDETPVVDRHRCHMAAMFGVFVDEDQYHKIRNAFSKFYQRHSELIVKYNIGLKTLLQQGISEPFRTYILKA